MKALIILRTREKRDRFGTVVKLSEELKLFVSSLMVELVMKKTGQAQGWLCKIAESIDSRVGLRWRTVSRVLEYDCTITGAGSSA